MVVVDRKESMEEQLLVGKNLLVVDDEADLRDIIASELEYMGAKVFQAENVKAAKQVLLENSIDLVVSDIRMPGGTGIDLLDEMKAKDVSTPPVILITGFADITMEDAFGKGAEALINKPFKLDDLVQMVVRFTSPLVERFKSETVGPALKKVTKTFPETLEGSMKNSLCSLGRGGIAVIIDHPGQHIGVDEKIQFEFQFKDLVFSGTGVCRWFKYGDGPSPKMMVALEFIKLNEMGLEHLLELSRKYKLLPFIPPLSF